MRACLVCSRHQRGQWGRHRVSKSEGGGEEWGGHIMSIVWAVVKTLVFSKRHEDLLNFEQRSDLI